MSDAPERIWVQREFHEACVRGSACIHETARHAIGYIREDVHAAALVAKDAEIARLRACLIPFCFFGESNDDTQAAWEMRYLDRFKDWIDFEDIENARAALNTQHKGETP